MIYRPRRIGAVTEQARRDPDVAWGTLVRYSLRPQSVDHLNSWGAGAPSLDSVWPFLDGPLEPFAQQPSFAWRRLQHGVERLPFVEPPGLALRAALVLESRSTSQTVLWMGLHRLLDPGRVHVWTRAVTGPSGPHRLSHSNTLRNSDTALRLALETRQRWAHAIRGPISDHLLNLWLKLDADSGSTMETKVLLDLRSEEVESLARAIYPLQVAWSLTMALKRVLAPTPAVLTVGKILRTLDVPLDSSLPLHTRLVIVDLVDLVSITLTQYSCALLRVHIEAHSGHRIHVRFEGRPQVPRQALKPVQRVVRLLGGVSYQPRSSTRLLEMCLPYPSLENAFLEED